MGSLHKWFSQSKSKDGKPGWVQSDGSPCANEKSDGKKTPKCFSSSKLASMSKGEIKSAVRRKREKDPNQQSKSGAAKPTYVSTDKPKKKMKKENFVLESDIKGKGSGKKDACYHKVKSRFKVWPSAYASGALVKCRKAGAKNWGNKKEETSVEAQYKKDTKYCLLCKKNETRDECSWGPSMWDKYTTDKLDVEEGVGISVAHAIDKTNPPMGSKRRAISGALKMREIEKTVARNKKKSFTNAGAGRTTAKESISYSQFMTEAAAWTRKAGKNPSGGLNEKGRKSYERENPGSDLKAPSKKVGNKRRASFCARMKGMKAKLTSKKTASDPDSRINKSLRAWNC